MKVGDKVEIIGEDMYIRTGYPIGYREAEKKLNGSYSGSFFTHIIKQFPFLSGYKHNHKIVEQFILAYNDQHLKFGGNDRMIHTEKRLDLLHLCGIISEVKKTMTGTRVQGGGYDDPTVLINQKAHMIYTLDLIEDIPPTYHPIHTFSPTSSSSYAFPTGIQVIDLSTRPNVIRFEKKNLKLLEISPA